MNDEQRFDEMLAEAAREHYNRPGETPREEIWSRIREVRRAAVADRRDDDASVVGRIDAGRWFDGGYDRPGDTAGDERGVRLSGWTRWGIGIAAALLVGIGLGRMSLVLERQVTSPTEPEAQVAELTPGVGSSPIVPAGAGARGEVPTPFRVAAIQAMDRADVVLTSFRSEASAGEITGETTAWARDLLSTTRQLLDSPASRDPRMGELLRDLELVLAQIASLEPRDGSDAPEVDLVADAVDRRDMLTKIRMVSGEVAAMGPDH